MRNKNCEITITLTNYSPEEIVLKLAEYVNEGFRICSIETTMQCCVSKYTFELVK